MRTLLSLAGTLLIVASTTSAASAKHNHGYHGYKNYGQYRRDHNPSANNDWSWERTQFRNRWSRMSSARRRALDAQMREQWRAYHHNNWNGKYSWNNYSDPAFLDYLHTSNPSLLTTLRTYLAF